jgi:hypothetical protein
MENGAIPARAPRLACALRLMDDASNAYGRDPELALVLTRQAQMLLGSEVLLAITELGAAGKLPEAGLPEFQKFIQLAEAGDVEIATMVLVKDHEWVPRRDMAVEKPRPTPPPEPRPAPISLKDELSAMGLIGNSPPSLPAAAAVPPPRAITPPDAQIPWQPPGRQVADPPPRLTVEIIPTSLHGQNPRTHFGRQWWDATRKAAYSAARYRCEICGGRGSRHPVELHERYSYDEHARPPVQRITGLIVLCPACHAVKHLYRTGAVAAENNDPAALDAALQHLREVNGWSKQQSDRYLRQVRGDYERREALGPWTADYSALSPA